MEKQDLARYLPAALHELPFAPHHRYPIRRGKVRDIVDLGEELIITTTDRISAFDQVLATVPCKGQVLNELSLFWFQETQSIVRNHIIEELSPRSVLVRKC